MLKDDKYGGEKVYIVTEENLGYFSLLANLAMQSHHPRGYTSQPSQPRPDGYLIRTWSASRVNRPWLLPPVRILVYIPYSSCLSLLSSTLSNRHSPICKNHKFLSKQSGKRVSLIQWNVSFP